MNPFSLIFGIAAGAVLFIVTVYLSVRFGSVAWFRSKLEFHSKYVIDDDKEKK